MSERQAKRSASQAFGAEEPGPATPQSQEQVEIRALLAELVQDRKHEASERDKDRQEWRAAFEAAEAQRDKNHEEWRQNFEAAAAERTRQSEAAAAQREKERQEWREASEAAAAERTRQSEAAAAQREKERQEWRQNFEAAAAERTRQSEAAAAQREKDRQEWREASEAAAAQRTRQFEAVLQQVAKVGKDIAHDIAEIKTFFNPPKISLSDYAAMTHKMLTNVRVDSAGTSTPGTFKEGMPLLESLSKLEPTHAVLDTFADGGHHLRWEQLTDLLDDPVLPAELPSSYKELVIRNEVGAQTCLTKLVLYPTLAAVKLVPDKVPAVSVSEACSAASLEYGPMRSEGIPDNNFRFDPHPGLCRLPDVPIEVKSPNAFPTQTARDVIGKMQVDFPLRERAMSVRCAMSAHERQLFSGVSQLYGYMLGAESTLGVFTTVTGFSLLLYLDFADLSKGYYVFLDHEKATEPGDTLLARLLTSLYRLRQQPQGPGPVSQEEFRKTVVRYSSPTKGPGASDEEPQSSSKGESGSSYNTSSLPADDSRSEIHA